MQPYNILRGSIYIHVPHLTRATFSFVDVPIDHLFFLIDRWFKILTVTLPDRSICEKYTCLEVIRYVINDYVIYLPVALGVCHVLYTDRSWVPNCIGLINCHYSRSIAKGDDVVLSPKRYVVRDVVFRHKKCNRSAI